MGQADFRHGSPLMVDYTPGSGVVSGQVIVQGEIPMIAHGIIAASRKGSLATGFGVYECTTDTAIGIGKKVYWDDTADKITLVAGTNLFFGWMLETVASATTGLVLHMPNAIVVDAQTVLPNSSGVAGNTILAATTKVNVGTVVNGVTDFIVLPTLADVPVGHTITIACNAGGAFEMRTPATSAEEINSEDCDGTKEYLMTDGEIVKVVKISDTIGWMAHGFSAIGAVVTAVVPD